MDPNAVTVAVECTRASDEERLLFPDIIGRLMAAGIERYHADLIRSEKTYYAQDGSSERVPCHAADALAAVSFNPAAVEAAVRASQAQQIGYREFCRRILQAGCVGYQVSLTGRRALYYGRTAETHLEHFPPS